MSSLSNLPPLLPTESTTSTSYKCRIIAEHLLHHLEEWRKRGETGTMMVGMQGPQGSGKTTITRALTEVLRQEPYNIRIEVLSLDDLYLTHEGLVDLASRNPSNALLQGRGLPGTHDLALAQSILSQIMSIKSPTPSKHTETRPDTNEGSNPHAVELPIFDKSLYNGTGDRSTRINRVEGPVDIFILEGWSMGFQALGGEELKERYESARAIWDGPDSPVPLRQTRPYFLDFPLESLVQVNGLLATASATLYPPFTVFIQLTLSSLSHIQTWRLEQELIMAASNGGKGMNAEEVERFVGRYLPGYELWCGGVREGEWAEGWKGRGLGLVFGSEREVLGVERF